MCSPFALIQTFMVSTTSTKTSFFLCLTSVGRQLVVSVASLVTLEYSS